MPVNRRLLFVWTATFLLISLFGPSRGTAAENVRTVSLFPFEVNTTAPDGAAKFKEMVNRGITAELVKTKNIRLVERERIAAAVKGKTLNDTLAIEASRRLGAAFAITGSVSEFGERISVDVKLIDVR